MPATAPATAGSCHSNLASIGYHFGSKDALLTAAVLDSFDDWDDAVETAARDAGQGTPADRMAAILAAVLEAMTANRALFAASVQALAQAEFVPQVRAQIAQAYRRARRDLPAVVLPADPRDVDDDLARSLWSTAWSCSTCSTRTTLRRRAS